MEKPHANAYHAKSFLGVKTAGIHKMQCLLCDSIIDGRANKRMKHWAVCTGFAGVSGPRMTRMRGWLTGFASFCCVERKLLTLLVFIPSHSIKFWKIAECLD